MNEEYARKMVKDVDHARSVLSQLEKFKRTDETLTLGHVSQSIGYPFIYGITVPKEFEDTFFFSLKVYAEEILGKYGLDK